MTATLTENSKKILETRYIDKEHDKTVDGLWDRVSMGNSTWRAMMAELRFLPNSPALFNLGLPNGGTSSACFVFDIQDYLLGDWPVGGKDTPFADSILGTRFKAACVAKAGGGVGYYLGNIRPKGSEVNSTHKKACGPVTVLKDLNGLRTLITQGGKRDLAQMGVLNVDHPDIREFIHVKDSDPQGLSSFNISVSWKDQFIRQVDKTNGKLGNAGREWSDLWWEQCESAWKTGCPGMLFWDAINRANATPHLGDINATNPCGETPNLSDEPCNLGSLAVCRYVTGTGKAARFDWDWLKSDVDEAIRFMDAILDGNRFPHPDITAKALATRKLGLGVMGWADLLALHHIPYDSSAAVDFGLELMKTIDDHALVASKDLCAQKGVYPAWETASEETKRKFPKARNSTRTSIAPTGTIAIIAGVWGSIEPHFALECSRVTYEGIQMEDGVPPWVKDRLNGFADFKPKVASEIDWKWHVRHQAAFQKHTDLGVSKTINLPNSATVQDVSDCYRMMWESGCKGGTIFRDGCRNEQVLVKKNSTSVYTVAKQVKKELPAEIPSIRHKIKTGGVKVYVHAGYLEENGAKTLVEIFFRGGMGSTVDGMLDTFAKTFSMALQSGVPLEDLVKLHRNSKFEPCGFTGNKEIPNCTSIPDYVVRWLEMKFTPKKEPGIPTPGETYAPTVAGRDTVVGTGEFCPDCGVEMIRDAGCWKCVKSGCGFSKC